VASDDRLAASVLDPEAGLALLVPVRWRDKVATVRAQMAVHNDQGLPLYVSMQVTKDRPWKPTAYLMHESDQLRRLDVNGSHLNRTPDRERWTRRTHKHAWSEANRDARAYTPDDIPDLPVETFALDSLRVIFEAFLAECHIVTGGAYVWSDPDLALRTAQTRLGEV
jgi:hypothetical protein